MAEGSSRGHGSSEEGGKAVGHRVRLPRGAQRPIKVFINGSEQVEGTDYKLHEGTAIFRDPIIKEDLTKLGPMRKFALGLGLVGTYQKNEIVDVQYQIDGKNHLASDLAVEPD